MALSVIIFDIGNVLLRFDYLRAARRLIEETGAPLERIQQEVFFSKRERDYSKGLISSAEFYQQLKAVLGFSMSFDAFTNIWNDIFWPNAGMEPIVRKLKASFRLASISNTTELHFRYWRDSFSILKPIDTFITSYEAHIRKPDPGIYRLALEQLRIAPHAALFIDDLTDNTEAARAIGMQVIHFQSVDQCKQELAKLGVQW